VLSYADRVRKPLRLHRIWHRCYPPNFWEQPEIRSVLLSRHFGRFLRTYRTVQQPQVKQTQLAHWLGITQGQLSRIERSSIPVGDLHKPDTWARVLHVPPDRLWFNPSLAPADPSEHAPNRAIVEKSQHNEGSDVRRRDLLKVAGVAAAAAGTGLLSETPWQRLIDSVDKGRPVDTATVQLMQDRTADLFHTEETVPARQLLESIAQHRNTLQSLLANARIKSIRNDLAIAMGETDVLTGWLLFDLGRGNDAANAWRSTLKIAKDTGDCALAACALGYWSYLATSRNDTAPAVRLLQQARDYVPGSSAPATRSWLSAREAEELARLGDETGALRAVERALTAYDFARPRVRAAVDGFLRRKQAREHDGIDIHDLASPGSYRSSRLIADISVSNGKQGSGHRAFRSHDQRRSDERLRPGNSAGLRSYRAHNTY
jgi:transcriptional regulator with XRE-family HTH domain